MKFSGDYILHGKYFNFHFEKHIYKERYSKKDRELIIQAASEEKAQQAYELFIAAVTLSKGIAIIQRLKCLRL
jgi:hypothetical protein